MARILVVDDDRTIVEMLRELLGEVGHGVDACNDGSQVLPRLRATPFDLLILDVLLPHRNGFSVLEALRQDPQLSELPVIVISGIYRRRNHGREMKKRFAVVEYLDKPIDTTQLLDLVHQTAGTPTPQKPVVLSQPKHRQSPVSLTRIKGKAEKKPAAQDQPEAERLVEPEAHLESREVEKDARRVFKTSAFLFQGSIRRNPVAALLGKLWHERACGALLLRRSKIKKIIYVKKGTAYAVKSNRVSECLGQLLVREHLISEEVCAASVREMKKGGRPQGEILIEMQAMNERNLAFALELQLEAKLFDAFRWRDGEFRYNSTAKLPPAGPTLEWRGAGVVSEGIRRAFDETRLRSLMIPVLDVPLRWRYKNVDLSDAGLSRTEVAAAEAMELPHTAQQLLEKSQLSPAVMLRVIYTLIALELLIP